MILSLILISTLISTTPPEHGHYLTVRCTAYTPTDAIDAHYRSTKGKWLYIAADGHTDVRKVPYGVAVPYSRDGKPLAVKIGSRIKLNGKWLTADDKGGGIRKKSYPLT